MLDENMLVYTYAEFDMSKYAQGSTEALETAEEFLFFKHKHTEASRYSSPKGTTLIGFTGHSCSMLHVRSLAESNLRGWERLWEHRAGVARYKLDVLDMFHTRYYLLMVITCFYRTVLLDFSERSALLARSLLLDQQAAGQTLSSIQMVNDFRTEFLNFSGYWHFDDLACKEADNDLFRRLCEQYRIDDMKETLSNELRHMGEFVYNFYQLRNTDAVNRLAMLSLIFGGGAVLTGFFGMNFGREFGKVLSEGEGSAPLLHYFLIALVTSFVFGLLALGTIVLLRNWRDYFAILNPPKSRGSASSLKRDQ